LLQYLQAFSAPGSGQLALLTSRPQPCEEMPTSTRNLTEYEAA
jgi:hypothetical protein